MLKIILIVEIAILLVILTYKIMISYLSHNIYVKKINLKIKFLGLELSVETQEKEHTPLSSSDSLNDTL